MNRKPSRRDFVKIMAIASAAGASGSLQAASTPVPAVIPARERWRQWAERLASPLLPALAGRRLKATMPVEAAVPENNRPFTHLEGFARLLCGLAPWLELGRDSGDWPAVAREALDAATDPSSPDYVNFTTGTQPLVDAAFLAQALLRAPNALWQPLPARVRANVIAGMRLTRAIKPWESNWLLFASMVEAFLHRVGEPRDEARLTYGLRRHADWYKGDGWYGDGPEFHTDYYNSYVIQPMLVEILDVIAGEGEEWAQFHAKASARLTRFSSQTPPSVPTITGVNRENRGQDSLFSPLPPGKIIWFLLSLLCLLWPSSQAPFAGHPSVKSGLPAVGLAKAGVGGRSLWE